MGRRGSAGVSRSLVLRVVEGVLSSGCGDDGRVVVWCRGMEM